MVQSIMCSWSTTMTTSTVQYRTILNFLVLNSTNHLFLHHPILFESANTATLVPSSFLSYFPTLPWTDCKHPLFLAIPACPLLPFLPFPSLLLGKEIMDHHVSSAMQSSTDLLSTAVWRDYCFGVSCCCYVSKRYERPPPECHCDPEVVGFSHVGQAVYQTLRRKHFWYHKSLWNVSTGRVVAIHATPHVRPPEDLNRKAFASSTAVTPPSSTSTSRIQQQQQRLPLPLPPGHTDWFPEHLGNLVSRTEEWCDILNLGPPDGLFLHHFAKALQQLHAKNKPIVIRMMFGHVLGMPINCKAVVRRLTSNLPAENTKLRLWVGAWRKGVSWNHSKIVAVDGFVVLTGGHNLWDLHYLRSNPVHDVSIELEGQVAQDAHFYANEQWKFLEKMDNSCFGSCITKVQDYAPVIFKTYVSLRRFPLTAPRHPPNYVKQLLLRGRFPRRAEQVPIISMGRNGALTRFQRRPSDDAIVAMLDSATTSCKLALQDLGPVTIPGTKITVPGCVWPHAYLSALGRILWQRNVKIQLILSNPQSVPGGLTVRGFAAWVLVYTLVHPASPSLARLTRSLLLCTLSLSLFLSYY